MPAEELDQATSQMDDDEWYSTYNEHNDAS
jgi:hypothetical protein